MNDKEALIEKLKVLAKYKRLCRKMIKFMAYLSRHPNIKISEQSENNIKAFFEIRDLENKL